MGLVELEDLFVNDHDGILCAALCADIADIKRELEQCLTSMTSKEEFTKIESFRDASEAALSTLPIIWHSLQQNEKEI
jgi:hypothetical protein